MLFTKLEKPLFLRNVVGLLVCASPENRFGLSVPVSDLGGVTSIIRCPPGGMGPAVCVWCSLKSGLVCVCIRGGGCDRGGPGVAPFEFEYCIDDRIPVASKGAPIKSLELLFAGKCLGRV